MKSAEHNEFKTDEQSQGLAQGKVANINELAESLAELGEFDSQPDLTWYRRLQSLPLGRLGFQKRIFLLAFVGTHLPLLILVGLMFWGAGTPVGYGLMGLILAATALGLALTWFGLRAALEPMQAVRDGLNRYLRGERLPNLPTYHQDEPGLMMRDTQISLMRLKGALQEVRELSLTDELTGLKNRRCMDERLPQMLAQAARYRTNLSVVLCDLDDFKQVNDTFGHDAGDKVLRELARILLESTRHSDLLVRMGGDEFVMVLPQTDMMRAARLARRIQDRIASELAGLSRLPVKFSISAGIVEYQTGMEPARLLTLADHELYRAKGTGSGKLAPIDTDKPQFWPGQALA